MVIMLYSVTNFIHQNDNAYIIYNNNYGVVLFVYSMATSTDTGPQIMETAEEIKEAKEAYIALYYQTVFPAKLIVDWLSLHGNVANREFSLGGSERYKTINDADDFYGLVCAGVNRIDYGSEWTRPPLQQNSNNNTLLTTPLFIDLDDWDMCAVCEQNKKDDVKIICEECFKTQMIPALVHINKFFTELGAKSIYNFYSSGRGVHVAIFDSDIMLWSPSERLAAVQKCCGTSIKFDVQLYSSNHMLRLPFSMNINTGRLCVPIFMDELDANYFVTFGLCDDRIHELIKKFKERYAL
jgi:DNA primase catalytic subunit